MVILIQKFLNAGNGSKFVFFLKVVVLQVDILEIVIGGDLVGDFVVVVIRVLRVLGDNNIN